MWLKFKKMIGKQFNTRVKVDSPAITDLNGYVNYDYDVALKFLPKCGSTSILHMLYQLENGVAYTPDPDRKRWVHGWAKENMFGPMSGVSRRIIIIRDPVKRFLSAYTNRVNAKKQLSETFVKENDPLVFAEIKHFNPAIDQFIDEFEIYRKAHQINHHTKPICNFIKPWSLDYFTDVIPMEQMSMIEDVMSDIFNCKAVLRHEQVSVKKIRLSDISESHLYKILDFYSEDYEHLSDYYTKDAVIGEWAAENKQREK